MSQGTIKSRKKPGFHSLLRKYIFRETTDGGLKLTPRAVLVLNAHASGSHPTLSIVDQSYSIILSNAFKRDLDHDSLI